MPLVEAGDSLRRRLRATSRRFVGGCREGERGNGCRRATPQFSMLIRLLTDDEPSDLRFWRRMAQHGAGRECESMQRAA